MKLEKRQLKAQNTTVISLELHSQRTTKYEIHKLIVECNGRS